MDNKPWQQRYDRCVPIHIDYPDISLPDLLRASAREFPEALCAVYGERAISYSEMDEVTDRLAGAFVKMGINKGDRVGLILPNTPQFIMAFFGILKSGAVVVAANPTYSERELSYQLKNAGVELVFVDNNSLIKVQKIRSEAGIRTLVVTEAPESSDMFAGNNKNLSIPIKECRVFQLDDLLHENQIDQALSVRVTPEDAAIFQYSGGTTGVSKAAIGLHRNLVANVIQLHYWMLGGRFAQDVVLAAIPLFHVYGMVIGMCLPIRAGAAIILISDGREVAKILKSIQDHKVTLFPGVPTMFNSINNHPDALTKKYDLSSIKACISGSAPLSPDIKSRFEVLTGGKLVEGYGLSEAPTATHCNPLLGVNKVGSIGLPLPDVDCEIISLEDERTIVKQGEIGELVIKAPQVFAGYHEMPAETKQMLRNGWLHTGDVAWMDEEGYFFLVDRKKDLIKPGGLQVWPNEVEAIIATHPCVAEVAVTGFVDTQGEAVKAWIVPRKDCELTETEIKRWCKTRLAYYKVPKHIEFLDKLPRSTVGKVLRRELRK